MKFFLLAFFSSMLFLSACGSPSLHGKVDQEELDGEMVYLYDLSLRDKVDSCRIWGGSFTFPYSRERGDGLMSLIGPGFATDFIMERKDLTFAILDGVPTVKGSRDNEDLSRFVQEVALVADRLAPEALGIYQDSLMGPSDRDDALRVLDEKVDREIRKLFHTYYERHEDDLMGVYLFIRMADSFSEEELAEVLSRSGDVVKKHPLVKDFLSRRERIGTGVRNKSESEHLLN